MLVMSFENFKTSNDFKDLTWNNIQAFSGAPRLP